MKWKAKLYANFIISTMSFKFLVLFLILSSCFFVCLSFVVFFLFSFFLTVSGTVAQICKKNYKWNMKEKRVWVCKWAYVNIKDEMIDLFMLHLIHTAEKLVSLTFRFILKFMYVRLNETLPTEIIKLERIEREFSFWIEA